MRRFPSGTTDQYIYFVAVDSTDLKTRETGLTSFTVYRARNGAAAAAYTTPTVAEVSSANMPGVYSLLLDEDMTIASGNKSEEVVLHITQASMAPVTLIYELYRPDVTDGETITVSSGAVSTVTTTTTATNVTTVNGLASNVITAASIAADAIGASELAADAATEIGTAVWAAATRTLTANTNLNDLSAAGVRAAVGLASANLDTQIGTLATGASISALNNISTAQVNSEVASALATYDGPTNAEMVAAFTEIKGATWATTDTLEAIRDRGDAAWVTATGFSTHSAADVWAVGTRVLTANTNFNDPSAASIADAVWDELLAAHVVSGSAGEQLAAAGAAGDPWATALPGAYGAGTAGKIIGDNINAPIDTVDSVVDAIKAKTDSLTFTVAGQVDANIQYVNDVQVNGTGASGDEWGPV